MRQEDICLRINGRKINQLQRVGGTPTDLSFFEYHQGYFTGKHKVSFRVGNQDIVSQVTMSGFDFQVHQNYTPVNVEQFVEAEKRRISKEQEDAGFQDRPQNILYVSGKEILNRERLPDFDASRLSKDPDGPKFFVSHRWRSPQHPDPTGEHLALLKQHARANNGSHYWIDYCCLPQPRLASDQKHFEKALPKLVSIQSNASTIIIMDEAFSERLWCYVEHYFGVLFSQTNIDGHPLRKIEYLGQQSKELTRMLEAVQSLQEPQWETLRITKKTDIPFIKLNYRFLTNIVKFQLVDRFVEMYRFLPGVGLYLGFSAYPQSAFGLNYSEAVQRIRELFSKYDWRSQNLFLPGALRNVVALFAHSKRLESFSMEDLHFSEHLIRSEEMVALMAFWLAVIQEANPLLPRLERLRTLYAKIVAISMLR